MKCKSSLLAILCVWVLTCGCVFALENQSGADANTKASQEEWEMWGWTASLGLSYFLLDKAAAESQQLEDSAFSVSINASYYFSSRVLANLGMGLINFGDNAEFSQTVLVTNIFGSDVETVESDASGFEFYTELLYLTPPISSTDIYFRAGAGYSGLAYAERSIDRCTDCRSENLELEGGPYLTAGVSSALGSEVFHTSLNFRQYLSGDINNSAVLLLEYFF